MEVAGVDDVNPVPIICIVVPAEPEVGFMVSVGAVRTKYALAVLPRASVTVTVLFVNACGGTLKVTLPGSAPPVEPEVVRDDDDAATTTTPLHVTVKLFDAEKPVPVTVTGVPLRPVVGVIVIAGVMVSVVNAVLVPSDTVT